MKDCHPKVEQMKAEFIDFLYEESGRSNGLYTGLWQQYKEECAKAGRLAWWECKNIDATAFDR